MARKKSTMGKPVDIKWGVTRTIGRAPRVAADATAQLLIERGSKHGEWKDNARIFRSLKATLHEEAGYRVARGQAPLTDVQREALEMIVVKVGRIMTGDTNYYDHWDDIMGYAKLGKEGR